MIRKKDSISGAEILEIVQKIQLALVARIACAPAMENQKQQRNNRPQPCHVNQQESTKKVQVIKIGAIIIAIVVVKMLVWKTSVYVLLQHLQNEFVHRKRSTKVEDGY